MKRPLSDEYAEVQQFERRAKVERAAKWVLLVGWIALTVAYIVGILHPEWFK